jgi:hypothetical protein
MFLLEVKNGILPGTEVVILNCPGERIREIS